MARNVSPLARQMQLDVHRELIVDLFAGGGGFSEGVLMASGRHPDIAINHNDDALSMHRANHPQTRHLVADVFEVCPHAATQDRPIGHLHLSPDCTHHSQARGGQPRNEKVRALSWVGKRWAGQVKPRVITLENVHQVEMWGPLIAKRDKATGRVVTLEMIDDPDNPGKKINRVADKGERVPREFQHLIPDPRHKGRTWRAFIKELENLGYEVKCQRMIAADYGAGTSRSRLFMHARNDGKKITFPAPTHHKKPTKGQKKWHAAHEYIDFGIESKSIFDRDRPLKENTMKRIAKGIKRFVIDSAEPFIVPVTHSSSSNVHGIRDPLPTITTSKGGEFALATPILTKMRFNSVGQSIEDPIPTITAGGNSKRDAGSPHALVECTLSPEDEARALRVANFIISYYGTDNMSDLRDPLPTITTKDRLALVTVYYKGAPYVIVDIKLRMLTPPELFAAQGFGQHYIFTHGHDGRKFSGSKQVKMCGNSVSPYPAAALFSECHRGEDMRLVA